MQVVDDSGAVVAASEDAPAHSPIATTRRSGRFASTARRFVTAVEGIDGDTGDGIVDRRARAPKRPTRPSPRSPACSAIAVPLVIALVALTSWFVVGRALSPVERMRRQVDGVTASTLAAAHRRARHVDDEIGRLAHTMNGMLDRLEAAQAAQRRFISDASHELKSPLAALRQYAEVARGHPERIGRDELSDAVLDEGGRLERLVQGMLVLARADEGALRLERSDVDLDDLLLDEARRVRDGGRLVGRHERHHGRAGAAVTSVCCASSCATSSTTPPGTPPRASPSRSRRPRMRHPWC